MTPPAGATPDGAAGGQGAAPRKVVLTVTVHAPPSMTDAEVSHDVFVGLDSLASTDDACAYWLPIAVASTPPAARPVDG